MLNLGFKQLMKNMKWWLLVCSGALSGVLNVMAQSTNAQPELRDPFQPIAAKICQPIPLLTAPWRLLGTVGSGKERAGWIATPDGHAQRFQAGDLLPSTFWQVEAVEMNAVVLHLSPKVVVCQNNDLTRFTLSLHEH